MATKVNIKDVQGKVDFSQSAEPTLNTEQKNTAFGFFDYFSKAINWLKTQLGDKANENRTVNYTATDEQLTTSEIYTLEDIINAYGGNITKLFSDLEALGIKDKKEYPITGSSGTILVSTHKITSPSVVAFYKNGTPIGLDYTIASNGDISWASSVGFLSNSGVKIVIIG